MLEICSKQSLSQLFQFWRIKYFFSFKWIESKRKFTNFSIEHLEQHSSFFVSTFIFVNSVLMWKFWIFSPLKCTQISCRTVLRKSLFIFVDLNFELCQLTWNENWAKLSLRQWRLMETKWYTIERPI